MYRRQLRGEESPMNQNNQRTLAASLRCELPAHEAALALADETDLASLLAVAG